MHACIAVDGDVADEELDEMSDTLAGKAMFEGHDVLAYSRRVFYAHTQIGSKQMIDNSVDMVAPENRANLFAQTIQLVLSDGVLLDKERDIIKYVYSALDLDEAVAKKIIDDFRLQNQGGKQNNPPA